MLRRAPAALLLVTSVTAAISASVLGCLAAPRAARGLPLYSERDGRPPPNQVATLTATLRGDTSFGGGAAPFIKAVDGRDVPSGTRAFELLPGCHVVELARRILITNTAVEWTGQLDARAFVFAMKPGSEYTVVVELSSEGTIGAAQMRFSGVERDASGALTGTFTPVAVSAASCAAARP
jgi:hypothetical protein